MRLLVSTIVGSTIWLAGAGAVRADLVLVFANPVAYPGAVVEAVTADRTGRTEVFPALRGIRVYFVPMTAARSPRHQRPTGLPGDPRWILLRPLAHRRSGVIRFRFTVPDVRPGDYTLGFWCRKCAPPRGATFTAAYPDTEWANTPFSKVLRVLRPAGHPADGAPDVGLATWVLLFAAVAGLIGAGLGATGLLRGLSP